jgi:molecular chaperone DnaJ
MKSLDDLYIILEVVRSATDTDIKRAYRKLARRYHPDINPGDNSAEERFKRISEAYEVLSDPLKRQFYDQNGFYTEGVLEHHDPQGSWGFSFKGFDFSNPPNASVGEMFGQFFSRKVSRRQPERGMDVEYQMAISFEDSISGIDTRISVQRRQSCAACNGSGRATSQRNSGCPTCGGSGNLSRTKGRLQFLVTCEDCGGTGRIITDCPECLGESRILRAEVMNVRIPPGVASGSRVRFPEKGDSGRCGGPSGDLYVITNVGSHPFFSRAGDNIQCRLPITFAEAVLGGKIEVPTVDGRTVVRIPPGTQNGQILRLRGKGAPSLVQPGLRGDQFVEVQIVVPRVADERSKAILREFAHLNSEDPRKSIWKT